MIFLIQSVDANLTKHYSLVLTLVLLLSHQGVDPQCIKPFKENVAFKFIWLYVKVYC